MLQGVDRDRLQLECGPYLSNRLLESTGQVRNTNDTNIRKRFSANELAERKSAEGMIGGLLNRLSIRFPEARWLLCSQCRSFSGDNAYAGFVGPVYSGCIRSIPINIFEHPKLIVDLSFFTKFKILYAHLVV